MGIFGSLRRGSGGGKAGPEEPLRGDEPTATWFRPRMDGSYVAPSGERLRFVSWSRVELVPADGSAPATGEYTGAGRFTVQARFERPVIFAVAEPDPGPETEAGTGTPGVADLPPPDHFVARRTDGRDRSTADVRYDFRPAGS
ncbi:hypothetical protein GIS00_04785 [Nakamurella sp. YIM 132087]|uniref:Uncharacterized protein n=1 Tax=Nakamurella alba TaxID=2665158 RepID=A0A7K1FJ20_9ACTN|nr:hypothetical protein [Nakamurella alba]MTD13263.1 hypothetical protein [Nakamurella alba]